MGWTRVRSPAPLWGFVETTNVHFFNIDPRGSGLRKDRKCRGKNAGAAWNVNFNNGNCNHNDLNNNNYVRAVR